MRSQVLLAVAGLAAFPATAMANAYAYTDLNVTGVTYAVTPAPVSRGTFSIFSDTAATYLGAGTSDSRFTIIPGTADAPQSRAGTALSAAENDFTQALLATPGARSDAVITAGETDGTAQSNAESHVLTGAGNFANASSGNRVSFAFGLAAGTVVSITVDFTRFFDLRTDVDGEVAVGTASITATLTNVRTDTSVPVTISGFNPNDSNSASDGENFSLSDGGTIIFTFAPVASGGQYTLNVAGRTTTDVRSAVPTPGPATIGLFGFALLAAGLRRRR